jgi:hypothetical protein
MTMKKLSILSALVLAWGVSAAAKADDKVRARLMGFQEVPVVSTEGSGTFEAVINRNGNAIDYEITYTGMQGTVLQSHMHVGQRSVNGGIVLWICGNNITTPPTSGPAGTPVCTSPNGHFAGTWRPENVQTVVAQQIATGELDEVIAAIRAGVAYVNVHTNISPGGEIRGQVRANRRD